MGVLYYAEYLHIFERARNQLIRERGITYAEIEAQGIFLPVREARCRYRRPARYDDVLLINAAVTEWGKASLIFGYKVWNEAKDALTAEGMTQHACVDGEGKPVAAPDWLRSCF